MLKTVTKYSLIIDEIIQSVNNGKLVLGAQAPSINEICEKHGVARETVVKAYRQLCEQGVLKPFHGKGYFIASTQVQTAENVFVLFDTLNAYKEILYKGITEKLGNKGKTDIYFHHFNSKIFESLIKQSVGKYSAYFIMPFDKPSTTKVLDLLPTKKLFILDRYPTILKPGLPGVFQEFGQDIHNALVSAKDKVIKYKRICYLPGKEADLHPPQLIDGLRTFCENAVIPLTVEKSILPANVKKGDLYIVIDDADLAVLITICREKNFKPGVDAGIISYNETPLKPIIDEGITTISTDFYKMGETIVSMLLAKKYTQIKNPSQIIIRGTL